MSIKIFFKQNKHLLILLVVVSVLLLIPILSVFMGVGNSWRGVPPQLANGYYYYSRIREIKDGNIFIGNPFFMEHNKEVAPAFFVADWFSAIPLLLGFSFNFTVIFNTFFWILVYVSLLYFLLRQFNLSKNFCFIGALLGYASTTLLMLRPVSMQTVYPFFALFLLAFVMWLKKPFDKKIIFFLISAIVLSFYVYTYLWLTVLVAVFLTIIYCFFSRKKKQALCLLGAFLTALVFATPLFVYSLKQISHPYYWESMMKAGLVITHLPAANIFYSGVWVILIFVLLSLFYFWLKPLSSDQDFKNLLVFSVITGLSFLINSSSNVITGKDMENSQHFERFIIVWLAVIFISLIYFFFKNREQFKNLDFNKKLIILIVFLMCSTGVIKYLRDGGRYILYSKELNSEVIQSQEYAAPLNWLENNEKEQKVVWVIPSATEINNYVTCLTKHYSLYAAGGVNFLVSAKEIEERYLTSRYFANLTPVDLENDYRAYAGVRAVHEYKTHNRKVKICKILRLDLFNYDCGQITDAISLRGYKYFNDLFQQYQNDIQPNINQQLKKFHVSYILIDKEKAGQLDIEKINNIKTVFQNEKFIIYKMP